MPPGRAVSLFKKSRQPFCFQQGHEHKVGTGILVTVATLVAVFGGETVAGAVLMAIILIAEFIAEPNTDRARASIKSLIGSVPRVALARGAGGEKTVPIADVKVGDVVLVQASPRIVGGRLSGEAGHRRGPPHLSRAP